MTTILATGSAENEIGLAQLHELIRGALDQLGERSRVLAVVPDASRAASHAGSVTAELYRYYPHRDHLIRRFGYRSRERLLELAEQDTDLYAQPAVLAHLLHGSSEGRFQVTYCPGSLTRAEIESVGYHYGVAEEWRRRLPPELPPSDWIDLDGDRWFYIADPGLSLWTL